MKIYANYTNSNKQRKKRVKEIGFVLLQQQFSLFSSALHKFTIHLSVVSCLFHILFRTAVFVADSSVVRFFW